MYFHFNILSGRKLSFLSLAFISKHNEIVTENIFKKSVTKY